MLVVFEFFPLIKQRSLLLLTGMLAETPQTLVGVDAGNTAIKNTRGLDKRISHLAYKILLAAQLEQHRRGGGHAGGGGGKGAQLQLSVQRGIVRTSTVLYDSGGSSFRLVGVEY